MDSFCQFLRQRSDQNAGDDSCDEKEWKIKEHDCVFHDAGGDNQLPDIMTYASGNADPDQTEPGIFSEKGHYGETQGCSGQAIDNAEKIPEKIADYDNADNGDQSGFFDGILSQDVKDAEIGKPKLNAGYGKRDRDKGFHIAEDNGYSGKYT